MNSSVNTQHYTAGLGVSQNVEVPFGWTIEQIAIAYHGCLDHVTAWVKGSGGEWIEVSRNQWSRIKPKISGVVRFGYRVHGSIVRSLISIVATVVAAVVAPFLLPVLGTIGTALATSAIAIGGAALASALFPANTGLADNSFGKSNAQSNTYKDVSSDQNILAKEASLPLVVGARRLSCPELAQPLPTLVNGTQSITRLFALEGPHKISDIQVDGTPVDDFDNITTEVIEGFEADPTQTFVDKISNLQPVQEVLSSFILDDTSLVDQDEPSNSEPSWIRVVMAADTRMEEMSLRLRVSGIYKTNTAGAKIRVPLRIRMREKGSLDEWINLPEIHIIGDSTDTILQDIRFRWDANFGTSSEIGSLSYGFFYTVPEVTSGVLSDGSTGPQWEASSFFASDKISAGRDGVRITISEEDIPKVPYEFEIIRGSAFRKSAFDAAGYSNGGEVYSFFLAHNAGGWRAQQGQGNYPVSISVDFGLVIADKQPCQRPKTCLIALQALGQSVSNVTVLAQRYVYDWDGTGWNFLTTSDNPATHYHHMLCEYLKHHNIDVDLIDNDAFVAWRQECIDRGYCVSDVFSGESLSECLSRIATAGLARLVFSDRFSIDYFRDRSSEMVVQTFSPRNSSVSVEWSNASKPSGIRASFQNADDSFIDDEIEVPNTFYTSLNGYDVAEYASISDPLMVETRAFFDILQSQFQSRRVYLIDADIEGIVCSRGDLIGLVTDLVDDNSSGMRIGKVHSNTLFEIDQVIPPASTSSIFESDDLFSESNLFTSGLQSVALISTPTGTQEVDVTDVDGRMIRVEPAVEIDDAQELRGAHIVIGPRNKIARRVIVSEVQPTNEERATLICLDEAPEIFEHMEARYFQ